MTELMQVARLREDLPADLDLNRAERRLAAEISAASGAVGVLTQDRDRHGAHARPRWTGGYRRRAVLAGAVAAAAAVAVVAVQLQPAGHNGTSAGGLTGTPRGGHAATYGRASSATELVAYATQAANAQPAFHPGPHEWIYTKSIRATSANEGGALWGPINGHVTTVTWNRVDGGAQATLQHGKLVVTVFPAGTPRSWPAGWPSAKYSYLESLPSNPVKLKAIILANLDAQHLTARQQSAEVFPAIQGLMENVLLPARLSAGLYGVLASLTGVHFAAVTDLAGRHGIGLYIVQGYLKDEIVINPSTYAYMGNLFVAVRAHTNVGLDGSEHIKKGHILGLTALEKSGIVQHAGQLPGS